MALEGVRAVRPDLLLVTAAPDPRAADCDRSAARVDADVRRRIDGLVQVAAGNGCAISLEELRVLLPRGAFPSPEHLGRFLGTDRTMQERFLVVDEQVVPRGRGDLLESRAVQRALTEDRLTRSQRFLERLERVCPWIVLAGISGSVAYGGTKPHDDVDFFLVTRPGRMWLTLALAMALARAERMRDASAPVYCFNRVTEREACAASFRDGDDPLFAREALNLRILRGGPFYRDLLRSAPWMERHFPLLYASRLEAASDRHTEPPRSGRLATALNLAAYVGLGTYLWSVGLVRNARHARAGRSQVRFRTVVERDFCAYESKKYDDLRDVYGRTF